MTDEDLRKIEGTANVMLGKVSAWRNLEKSNPGMHQLLISPTADQFEVIIENSKTLSDEVRRLRKELGQQKVDKQLPIFEE